ncbi:FecR family protein [Dyadobacter sp. NIV53]|uniref:FecR family protein n=1 Tax=Dyadobacter sp. NIV53 TaxID=2861765 RepID=UPI001C87ED86|nr:FecR domain-containing protein [Dyadobacter sp. NIV53]
MEAWYASLRGNTDYLNTLAEPEQIRLQKETFQQIQDRVLIRKERPAVNLNFRWLAGIAASFILAAGIYFAYWYAQNPVEISTKITSPKKSAGFIHFVNNESRIVLHTLPDGSQVWMHANAAINYPGKFDTDKRAVTFRGEGFFNVKPDKTRPFTIQSGDMTVKVLGTSFNVKAPEKQKIFEISVVTGSVEVTTPGQKDVSQLVILKPKEQAFFETEAKRLTLNQMPVQTKKEIYEPLTIVFEGTPLHQVAEMLNSRFDSHIRLINPDMSACRLTADFEQQSLPAILEMLCTSLDATYTMSGKTILLNGPSCE